VLDSMPALAVLPLLAGIPLRAGFDSAGRGFLLNLRVPCEAVEHAAAHFLRIGAALGVPTHHAQVRFVPTPADHARADELWHHAGLGGSHVVAVFPGGGRNPVWTLDAKRWPPARYAALADRLYADYGLAVVLAGSEDDRPVTAAVQRLMRAPVVDLAGRTSFGTLGALFARCALFAGNDCGPMHLAAAVGTPVVAIFGPTDPALYGPFSRRAVTLRGPRGVSTEEVSVDDAVAAAERLLI
jgi:ADP-heptose:LPS heptosyltransferase